MLVPKGSSGSINHPDAVPSSPYTMPNLDDAGACSAYRALLSFLAERYTRPDGRHGFVSHWIMHNEVDFGWQWTNMGEAAMPVFTELYVRSMRLMALEGARWNPEIQVFTSFTHYWDYEPQEPLRYYAPREMLELILKLSEVEGDFPWAVSYHPYPENLKSADPWDDRKPTYSFDTPMITPKNFEVLDAYLRQERFLRGGEPRPVLFSEQGYHTPDYGEESQRLQAAAILYTFEKLRHLPIVKAYHYHRWIDHPNEGGLQCGLRQLPEGGKAFGPRKFAFEVYAAVGTPAEEKYWPGALEIIGVASKEEIPYRGPIDTGK
jgi:hypothetical protein